MDKPEPYDMAVDVIDELLELIPVPRHDLPIAQMTAIVAEKIEEALGEI